MRPIIYPYKMGSNSARLLQQELQRRGHRALRVHADRNYHPHYTHLVINWGNSREPTTWGDGYGTWLNPVIPVMVASNKLAALELMQGAGINVPEFTTCSAVAQQWVDSGWIVVCRRLLTANGGRGIVLVSQDIEDGDHTGVVPQAPLYVKYIKKKHEYRIHVFNGEVIDEQQKKKRAGQNDVDYKIRNHTNGWVFARNDIRDPGDTIRSLAVSAVNALGLNFGAVDTIYNSRQDRAYVLEVNTAPGLEGTTLLNYADAIERLL